MTYVCFRRTFFTNLVIALCQSPKRAQTDSMVLPVLKLGTQLKAFASLQLFGK